jgi:streptogramin lyase
LNLGGIAAGRDSALWFTTTTGVGRITTGGVFTGFPFFNGDLVPEQGGITAGPDGALWFARDAGVGRITTSGAVTGFDTPTHGIRGIATGPDGAMWFTRLGNVIGRITVPLSTHQNTADFSADGKSDILWQNTNGRAAIWLMNGTTPNTEALVGANPGPSWQVIGSGNFHDHRYSDILWQNAGGTVAIWEINGTKVIASAVVGNPGTSWHVIGE